jgi:hypothetical protein
MSAYGGPHDLARRCRGCDSAEPDTDGGDGLCSGCRDNEPPYVPPSVVRCRAGGHRWSFSPTRKWGHCEKCGEERAWEPTV